MPGGQARAYVMHSMAPVAVASFYPGGCVTPVSGCGEAGSGRQARLGSDLRAEARWRDFSVLLGRVAGSAAVGSFS